MVTPCPSKRSHINPSRPPRVCVERCARYLYAAHLSGGEWIAPAIKGSECPNFVPIKELANGED